jgi:hypothetical protein
MSGLAQLPPAEARRLLVLGAMSVRSRPVAREPVAIIRANGAEICVEDADVFYRSVAHLLIARKRRLREAPDDSDLSGPLVVDLNDLVQHRETCAVCSEQACRGAQLASPTPRPASIPSVFDDFGWGLPATEPLAGGTTTDRP